MTVHLKKSTPPVWSTSARGDLHAVNAAARLGVPEHQKRPFWCRRKPTRMAQKTHSFPRLSHHHEHHTPHPVTFFPFRFREIPWSRRARQFRCGIDGGLHDKHGRGLSCWRGYRRAIRPNYRSDAFGEYAFPDQPQCRSRWPGARCGEEETVGLMTASDIMNLLTPCG